MNEMDDPKSFESLSEYEQGRLIDWIKENLIPTESFNLRWTSYNLKKLFERSGKGFYVENGTFKGAMLKSEFKVKDKDAQNWVFNISQKSPAFIK